MAKKPDEKVQQLARILSVTRQPKPNLFARQILNPCYYQPLRKLCIFLSDGYAAQAKHAYLSPEEIEGIILLWADIAHFPPLSPLEKAIFKAMDKYAKTFDGWIPSPGASINILPSVDEFNGFRSDDEDEEEQDNCL